MCRDGDPRHRRRRHVHRRGAARRRALHTAKVPTRGRQEESVVGGGARARGGAAAAARAVHARHDRRDERAARAKGRPNGIRRDEGLRAPPAPPPPEPRATSTGSTSTIRSRSSRSSAASAWASASVRTAWSTPLDLSSLPEVDAEAIAVCLLFSFRDPSHERAVAAELRRRIPTRIVVASHEVAPEFREYERASTDSGRRVPRPARRGAISRARRRGRRRRACRRRS